MTRFALRKLMKLRYIPILTLIVLIIVVVISFLIQINLQNELIEKQRQIMEDIMQGF